MGSYSVMAVSRIRRKKNGGGQNRKTSCSTRSPAARDRSVAETGGKAGKKQKGGIRLGDGRAGILQRTPTAKSVSGERRGQNFYKKRPEDSFQKGHQNLSGG